MSLENSPQDLLRESSLRNRLRFLLKDSVVYGGAAAISKAAGLITFPALARHFSVEEFGVLDLIASATALLTVLLVFGQDSSVARFYYEYSSKKDRQEIISQSLLKWTFSRRWYLVMTLGHVLFQSSVIILGIVFFQLTLKDVLLLQLAVAAPFAFLGLYSVRGWIKWPKNLVHVPELLKFAAPYGMICLLAAFSPVMERALIASFISVSDMGEYAVASKIATLLAMVSVAFQTAWGPFSLALYKDANASSTYNLVAKVLCAVLIVLVFGISFLATPLIEFLVSEKYEKASSIVFPLVMAIALQTLGGVLSVGINISKKSYLNLIVSPISLAITAACIFVFTPCLGIYGVALSVLAGGVAKLCMSAYMAQRAYPLTWSYSSLVMVIGLTIFMGLFVDFIGLNGFGGERIQFVLIALVLTSFMVSFILFNSNERSKVVRYLSKVWRVPDF